MSARYVDSDGAYAGQQVWGQALVDAYLLEQSQKWHGGAVAIGTADTDTDDAGLDQARNRGFLVDYRIPLKTKPPFEMLEAINWPKQLSDDRKTYDELFRLGIDGRGANLKRANAARFYRYCKAKAANRHYRAALPSP
jgi:hypothetical protein